MNGAWFWLMSVTRYIALSLISQYHCLDPTNRDISRVHCIVSFVSSKSKLHDNVINWKHFLRYWSFVRGIHQSQVDSPHKGQWHGTLMFSLICTWTNGWANNRRRWVETPSCSLWRHCNVKKNYLYPARHCHILIGSLTVIMKITQLILGLLQFKCMIW